MKWCACVGLGHVSFGIEAISAVTEPRRRENKGEKGRGDDK